MKSIKFAIITLAAALGVATVASAQTTSDLAFTYSDAGKIVLTNTFDTKPSKACKLNVKAAVHYNTTKAAANRWVGTIPGSKLKAVTKVTLTGNSGVKLAEDGTDPAATFQTALVCPGKARLVSNPMARCVKCGAGLKLVTPKKFLSAVAAKFVSKGFGYKK